MNDKKNAIKGLQSSCKAIKYKQDLNQAELITGAPTEFLKIYHYLLLDYSPLIAAEILNKHNMELNTKNDKQFIDGVYKLCRDMFNYVPKLTKDQFFQTNYAAAKCVMCSEIIDAIKKKNDLMQPPHATTSTSSSSNLRANVEASTSSTNEVASTTSGNHSPKTIPAIVPAKTQSKQFKTPLLLVQNHMSTASSSGASNPSQKMPPSGQKPGLKKTNSIKEPTFSYYTNFKENNNPIRRQQQHQSEVVSTNEEQNLQPSIVTEFMSVLNDIKTNVDSFKDRLENIEKCQQLVRTEMSTATSSSSISSTSSVDDIQQHQVMRKEAANNFDKIANEVNKLNATITSLATNLSAKITVIENDNMLIKQNLKNLNNIIASFQPTQSDKTHHLLPNANGHRRSSNRNSEKFEDCANDCTEYETPFHSFLNISENQNINEMMNDNNEPPVGDMNLRGSYGACKNATSYASNRKSLIQMTQGLPYDIDASINLNDQDNSLNSNDSTPTLQHHTSTTKFAKQVDNVNDVTSTAEQISDVLRAKQLVMRVSKLNEDLSTQLKI